MGALKRCLRLMAAMTDKYEIFSLNFGPFFEGDPLQLSLASRVTFLAETPASELDRLFRTIAPDAVVLGECPLAGSMRKAYQAAIRCGIPQFAIDNYYGRCIARIIQTAFWKIRRWLMLGLAPQPDSAKWSWGREVVPPLLPALGETASGARDGIVVIGYDRATLEMALEILRAIGQGQKVDMFCSGPSRQLLAGLDFTALGHELRYHWEPEETELYQAIARSRLVLGKAGFQQIVESLSLGTPVVFRMVPGGLRPFMLPRAMRPYVQPVRDLRALPHAMPRIRDWVSHSRIVKLGNASVPGQDPVRFAASRLESMIEAG